MKGGGRRWLRAQAAQATPTHGEEPGSRRGLICSLFQALVLLLACGHLAFLTVHFLAEENQIPLLRPETAQVPRGHIWTLSCTSAQTCILLGGRAHLLFRFHILEPACNCQRSSRAPGFHLSGFGEQRRG